jgi:hypothetical protein
MDDEWMADVNVPGSTGREGSGSFERRGRKIATVELHTAFAVRRKHAGYVHLRLRGESIDRGRAAHRTPQRVRMTFLRLQTLGPPGN